jgi:hypothetical protein
MALGSSDVRPESEVDMDRYAPLRSDWDEYVAWLEKTELESLHDKAIAELNAERELLNATGCYI